MASLKSLEQFRQIKEALRTKALEVMGAAFQPDKLTKDEYEKFNRQILGMYACAVVENARRFNVSLSDQIPCLPEELDQCEIVALAYQDPTLCVWVNQWRSQVIAWERMIFGLIWSLLAERQRFIAAKARELNVCLSDQVPFPSEAFGEEEMLTLANHDPILNRWMCRWQSKDITWEQTTCGVIWSLFYERQQYSASASSQPPSMAS